MCDYGIDVVVLQWNGNKIGFYEVLKRAMWKLAVAAEKYFTIECWNESTDTIRQECDAEKSCTETIT